jgi:lactate dehydrogenase-like 2-hydroxyacid dehydrogenase
MYSDEQIASMRRQAWLIEQARGGTQDAVTAHGHALRHAVVLAAAKYARTKEPADFDAMQARAALLDAYVAGLESAVEGYAAASMHREAA